MTLASDSSADLLQGAWIAPEVLQLCPGYRAVLVAADGLRPGASDAGSDAALSAAEATARSRIGATSLDELPQLQAWRAAYRAFGAKPQRTRPSVEALLRRLDAGLPRVDRITDTYNAISVAHLLPLGGEDLDAYQGPPRLVRAGGGEDFDTVAAGQPLVEHPDGGEVVWLDDAGVTCRRWNWRQCTRTRITDRTRRGLFILDALDVTTDAELLEAADELITALAGFSPGARFAQRLLSSSGPEWPPPARAGSSA